MRFLGRLTEVMVVISRKTWTGLMKFDIRCESKFSDTEDASRLSLCVWRGCLEECKSLVHMCAESVNRDLGVDVENL